MEDRFDFTDYLRFNSWKLKSKKIWFKGNKSLSITKNGLMIALNNKEGIKHKHIVTCEIPSSEFEADIIFKKCRLNFKLWYDDSENKY